MTRLAILHPEPAVRTALGQTLAAVWPGLMLVEGEAELYLATASAPATPPERSFLIETPLRLQAIIAGLQSLLQRLDWPRQLEFGDARLDCLSRRFTRDDGEAVDLTEKEIGILVYLSQRGAPATRDDLLRDVWDYAADADTHTIETHIYRLRQKIEGTPETPQLLLTGKDGYQLAARSKA